MTACVYNLVCGKVSIYLNPVSGWYFITLRYCRFREKGKNRKWMSEKARIVSIWILIQETKETSCEIPYRRVKNTTLDLRLRNNSWNYILKCWFASSLSRYVLISTLYNYYLRIIFVTGPLAKWVECSPIVWKTRVQSQIESYQRLKKWYLMPPCLTLRIIG